MTTQRIYYPVQHRHDCAPCICFNREVEFGAADGAGGDGSSEFVVRRSATMEKIEHPLKEIEIRFWFRGGQRLDFKSAQFPDASGVVRRNSQ